MKHLKTVCCLTLSALFLLCCGCETHPTEEEMLGQTFNTCEELQSVFGEVMAFPSYYPEECASGHSFYGAFFCIHGTPERYWNQYTSYVLASITYSMSIPETWTSQYRLSRLDFQKRFFDVLHNSPDQHVPETVDGFDLLVYEKSTEIVTADKTDYGISLSCYGVYDGDYYSITFGIYFAPGVDAAQREALTPSILSQYKSEAVRMFQSLSYPELPATQE